MARIATVSTTGTEEDVAQALDYIRGGMAEMTGRATETMMEPFELYAHVPPLFRAYVGLEQAVASVDGLDKRIKALAQLKAATLTQCEYCIDLGSNISRRWGLSDKEMLALPHYRTSPLFSDTEKLVLDYATGMSRTPLEVTAELVAVLQDHFDEAQIVELTQLIALENMRGRFNLALGVGSSGLSEGMVCAVPA